MSKDKRSIGVSLDLESQRIKKSIKGCEFVGFALEFTFNSPDAAKLFAEKTGFQKLHRCAGQDEKSGRLLKVSDHLVKIPGKPAHIILLKLAITERSVIGVRIEHVSGREIFNYRFPRKK